MSNGWDKSAAAWIADMGEHGDYGRRHVLDPVMRGRLADRGYRNALDVGCGEGRFCRIMQEYGIATTGIDPTAALLAEARRRDPAGDYRAAQGEALPLADASFDLVVSCLTLIDIEDIDRAIPEMARVLRPGGTLLVANLASFATAGTEIGWQRDEAGSPRYYAIDRYLEERASWAEWRGIRIRNWHRPLSRYMGLLLAQNLRLTWFAEPSPLGGEPGTADRYRRVPYYMLMEWQRDPPGSVKE